MPSPTTEEMTEQLKTLVTGLDDAFARFELLDETGRVPSTPLFSRLMQHADAAKELSRTAVHLAAVVGIPDADSVVDREMDSKIRARLANVAEHTLRAVDLFTRTAETSASPTPAPGSAGAQRREGRMVVDHASARAELRRAAEATGETITLLKEHAELRRLLASMLRRPTTTPLPPQPRPRRTR
ncbi:hypothetical protein OG711_07925 [Streptomyces uncialis]|uniref:hypothetical protein n=1 Tax=Streptomyces uncialis TaxID=1048205 RepID=UPI002E31E115|nr:hypothetical protein [Streptomyces uncialis]